MVLLAEINHLRKESKENLAYLSILLCSLCLSPLYTNIMQQKSIVNKQSTCFRLALKWTRHRRTKEIITQRVTLEERDKTRVTFTTYFLLLNPHSLRQVEVTAGQKSTIILASVRKLFRHFRKLVCTRKLSAESAGACSKTTDFSANQRCEEHVGKTIRGPVDNNI